VVSDVNSLYTLHCADTKRDPRQRAHRAVVHPKVLPIRWVECFALTIGTLLPGETWNHIAGEQPAVHLVLTTVRPQDTLVVRVHSLLVVRELCHEYFLNSNSNPFYI